MSDAGMPVPTDLDRAAASNPQTPLGLLADLAYEWPTLRPLVAENPSAYDGLLEWLGALRDPNVDAALRARAAASVVAPRLANAVAASPVAASPDVPEIQMRVEHRPKATLGWTGRRKAVAFTVAALSLTALIIAISVSSSFAEAARLAAEKQQGIVAAEEEIAAEVPLEEQPDPEPEVEVPAPPVLDASGSWSFANKSGYSYDMTISLGDPIRYVAGSGPTHPGSSSSTYGSACAIDPAADVIIPASWAATATTADFSTAVEMSAIIADSGSDYAGSGIAPFNGDDRVSVEQYFSDGPHCSTFSSSNIWGYGQAGGFGVSFADPLANGAGARSEFAIIVRNYYTPATPDGDLALLDWITVRPLTGGDKTDPATAFVDVTSSYLGIYSTTGLTLSGQPVTY